jgi:UDP-2,3-diacylglucosamine pyrophosphatase LpxH
MGIIFDVQQTNIVAYLTTSSRRVPRISYSDLDGFLAVLAGQGEQPPEGLFSFSDPSYSDTLISISPNWIEAVKRHASLARQQLKAPQGDFSANVPQEEVATQLAALRGLWSDYNLFGLAVGSWRDDLALRAFTNYAAIDSGSEALFLVPAGLSRDAIRLLDPFPAVSCAVDRLSDWPGIVFWSRNNVAAFAPLAEAKNLYHDLRPTLSVPRQLDDVLEKYTTRTERARLLQLSDLHFGTEWAQVKEPYLSTHLKSISASIGRVVITGDLFNEPVPEHARAFYSFRTAVEREHNQQAVVIPGNHDQKWLGNLGRDLGEIGKVEWSSVFVDDKTGCVFFCFDSSRDADWARGKVTTEQRVHVATEFDKLSLTRPEIRDYLRVALVHHHPFSFEEHKETFVARRLERVSERYFLQMDDAKSFVEWCAGRGVQLILHGHKHLARYREESIKLTDGWHQITSVGCGTSLGAEGRPLSYNLVTWARGSNRWKVSFFSDPGDGSGFVEDYLSVHTVQ